MYRPVTPPPASNVAALGLASGDVTLDPVAVRSGDHRTDDSLRKPSVADLQRLGVLREAIDHCVIHGAVCVDPSRRSADLARVKGERRTDGTDRGLQGWASSKTMAAPLAAELHQHPLPLATGNRPDRSTHLGAASEADHVDLGCVDAGLTDLETLPGD